MNLPTRRSGLVDIVSLLVLYLILAVVVSVFLQGTLREFSPRASLPMGVTTLIMIIVTVALVLLLAFFIVRLAQQRRSSQSGRRLRGRLVAFFLIIVGLASLPQAIIFYVAARQAQTAWYNARIEKGLAGSERLALAYSASLRESLRNAADLYLPGLGERYMEQRPELVAQRLTQRYPQLRAVQVFARLSPKARYAELEFQGSEPYRLKPEVVYALVDGELPSISSGDSLALRYLKRLEFGGSEYAVVLSMGFPADWVSMTNDIQTAAREVRDMAAFMPSYRLALGWCYFLFATPLLLCAILMALMMADLVFKPLDELERATQAVAAGDFSATVFTRAQDDFASFAGAFNRMVGELERYSVVMLQNEKITAWQDIAQKLAHEIKNPLTPIRLSAERVLRKYREDPQSVGPILEKAMLAILQEVQGINILLGDFRSFAKLPEPQRDWTEPRSVVAELAMSFESSHPKIKIDYSRMAEGTRIRADGGHLRQLFMNLISNAVDAMEGVGTVRIGSDLVKRSDTEYCRLEIRDEGNGIPADIQKKLFTPYFTTKRMGTGLGLSIVEHIVVDHKGEIWFETEQGIGTTFYIDLPV